MKHLQLLTVFLMLSALGFGQNQSFVPIDDPILPPDPLLGSQEKFRFAEGIITQLDDGANFDFNSSRWFSIGRLDQSNQSVYGLRFQLPRRAITMSYQDTQDINPRIQWIGLGPGEFLGDLEFRVADDFQSTNSDLVATMRNDGTTIFSSQQFQGNNTAKVRVFSDLQYGLKSATENEQNEAIGVFGFGNTLQGSSIGVFGRAATSPFSTGILGVGASMNPGNIFAGFFDGDLTYTANFFQTSDEKFKENVDELEFALKDLMRLQPKTYNYISSKKINLAEGKQFGFIAQELEEVFPELIKEISKPVFDGNDEVKEYLEYKSVNYLGLIAVLTGAIQELAEEVERLKETNESYVVYSDRLDAEEMERLRKLAYQLEQNYPNPFQGRTSIEYSIPDDERNASIMVFNMSGKLLKEFKLREKTGKIEITSDEFQPGIYLYSLISDNNEIITKKMIVK